MKQKIIKTETETVSEENPQQIETPIESRAEKTNVDDDIKMFLDSLSGEGDIVVRIYKYDDASNHPRYRMQADPESVSEAYIQEQLKAGRFLLRVFKEGRAVGSKTVYIGDPPLSVQKDNDDRITALPAAPAPAGLDPLLALQLETMRQDNQNQKELLFKIIDKLGNNGKSNSSITELVEVMTVMKQLNPPPAPENPLKMLADAFPLVEKLIDMVSSGGGSQKPSWLGLAGDLVKEVPKMLGSIIAAKNGKAASDVSTSSLAVDSQLLQIDGEALEGLRQGLFFLKTRAQKNSDPGLFVDLTMDTLDQKQSLALVSVLERPYEEIAKIDPDLLNPAIRPWFEKFFEVLKNALQQSVNSIGDTSNQSNPADNEQPG